MLKGRVKRIKGLFAMLLAVIMTVTSVTIPMSAKAADDADVTSYVNDLILYYRDYQEDAQTDIDRVLDEMRAVDKGQADAWEKIMDYWSEVNSDGFVNVGTVPEGLPKDDSVAIVILGFALNDDGTMKEELIGRLQTGLNIAEAYPNSYVVVTGGGTAKNNPDVTEGGLMGEWLLAQGLDESRLIVENRAPDTVGNAKYTYEILKEKYPQVGSVVLVTSDYHVSRGCILYYSKFVLDALSTGKEPLEIIANAGYYTNSSGYETIALQAKGVASVVGISLSGSVELSKLSSLKIVQNTPYQTGSALDLAVEASYNTGYNRDVTELVSITGFDPEQSAEQVITVSYTENGVTVEGTFALTDTGKTLVVTDYLRELLEKAEAAESDDYTKASYEAFAEILQDAKAVLEKEAPTKEEVEAAYADLNLALNRLRPLTNAAYYMSVTADSNSDSASKLTDGSTSTYWESAENGGEAVIELDGLYALEKITVKPYDTTAGYDVSVSENNVDWTVAAHSDGGSSEASYAVEAGINVKYIKITGSEKLQLAEVYAYGEEADNLILGKEINSSGADLSASSSAGATDFKAVDGDRSSYWDAGAYASKPWITVDLGGIYQLDKVNVINYWKNSDRYYNFEVYTSIDGEIYTLAGGKDTKDKETIYGNTLDFSGQTVYAAYIKVVGTYNSKNSAFHINEIRAYGVPADKETALVHEARRALQSLTDECIAEDYQAEDYTEASFASYQQALNAAKTLLADENSGYEAMKAAAVTLSVCVKSLEYRVDDSKAEGTFRVASFNIKSKANPDTAAIRDQLFKRYAIDLAGLQEVDKNTTRNPYDVLASFVNETYSAASFQEAIVFQGGSYGNGILSTVDFVSTDGGKYEEIGSEGRAWHRVVFEMDGKEVALYNTHFALEYEVRVANLYELLEVMENDPTEYKILTGDFNCTWESMYPFLEEYNLANGKDGNWICTTNSDWTGEDLVTEDHAIDNIITTRNIEVTNITVIESGDLSDHKMIYADCRLLDEAVVSTEYLDIVIADAEQMNRDGIYTEESYSVFVEALSAAKAVDKETASQEEVNAALYDLQDAMEQLDRIIDNVALGKEVSGDGDTENVTDGDIFTEWSSEELSDAVVIDLEDIYEIDELKVVSTPKQAGTYGVKYDVYFSTDNETFTKVAAKQTSDNVTSKGNTFIFDEPVLVRYIKVQFTYTTSEEIRLSEVEAYGEISESNAVYRELLEVKINECSDIDESLYTPETVALLKEVLENAKAVSAKQNPLDGELKDAYDALVLAFNSLTLIESEEGDTDDRVIENLALYGEVTVDSGTKNYTLTDGKVENSYWGSANGIANAYAIVELPGRSLVDEVKVVTYYNKLDKWYTYEVLISNDKENWTSIGKYEAEENVGSAGYTITLDEPTEAKYVKVQGLNTNNTNLHLVEIAVYGSYDNIALEKGVTVSYGESANPGTHIVDGNMTNYWGSETVSGGWSAATAENYPYAIINLGSVYELDSVNVLTYLKSGRIYKYEVYTSLDGIFYTLLGAKTDDGACEYFSKTFNAAEPVTAKYIKIVGTYNSGNTAFHLREVRATGELAPEAAADYTKVNAAISSVPEDLTLYTMTSVVNMKLAVMAVDENLTVSKQAVVDEYAEAILKAIAELEYKPADYTKVRDAIAAANALVKENYADFSAVEDAIAAVIEGLDITKQAEVDAMAQAIDDAVAALALKGADYSKIEALKAQIPADLDAYTEESVAALEAALAQIEDGLDFTHQEQVDQWAEELQEAVNGLEEKPDEPETGDSCITVLKKVIKTVVKTVVNVLKKLIGAWF